MSLLNSTCDCTHIAVTVDQFTVCNYCTVVDVLVLTSRPHGAHASTSTNSVCIDGLPTWSQAHPNTPKTPCKQDEKRGRTED